MDARKGLHGLIIGMLILGTASAATYEPGGLYSTDGDALYIIDKNNGAATAIGIHYYNTERIGGLAFDRNGILYGLETGSVPAIYTIDTTDGTATHVADLDLDYVFEGGLYFNEDDGKLYGVDVSNFFGVATFTYDISTGETEKLPEDGYSRDLNGLTWDGQTLYAIDGDSNTFGTVDLMMGAYTPIGDPGFNVGAVGGLATDPATNDIFAVLYDGGLFTIDKSTGLATFVGPLDTQWGLAFAPDPPVLDIQIDGQQGPITVPSTQSVVMTIHLDPRLELGTTMDWWIVADKSWGNKFSWVWPGKWILGRKRAIVYPLIQINSYTIHTGAIPVGTWRIEFAVDSPDNIYQGTYSDLIRVTSN